MCPWIWNGSSRHVFKKLWDQKYSSLWFKGLFWCEYTCIFTRQQSRENRTGNGSRPSAALLIWRSFRKAGLTPNLRFLIYYNLNLISETLSKPRGWAFCINLNRDVHLLTFLVHLKNNRLQISTLKKITGHYSNLKRVTAFLVPKTNVILVLQLRWVVPFQYKIEVNELKGNPLESTSRN